MGGGSKKAPEPTKFVSPPIDNSPATRPIPNFFQGNSVQRPPSPYEMMSALGQAQPQTPQSNPVMGSLAPLLQTQALPPSTPQAQAHPRDLVRDMYGAARGMASGTGTKEDYNKALREAVAAMFKGSR